MSEKKNNDWRMPPSADAESALNALRNLSFDEKMWVVKMARLWVVPFRGIPPRDLMTINFGLTRLAGALNGATNRGILGEETFQVINEQQVRTDVVDPVIKLLKEYANKIDKAIKKDKKSRKAQGRSVEQSMPVQETAALDDDDAVDLG